jgi:hypothetical protein
MLVKRCRHDSLLVYHTALGGRIGKRIAVSNPKPTAVRYAMVLAISFARRSSAVLLFAIDNILRPDIQEPSLASKGME